MRIRLIPIGVALAAIMAVLARLDVRRDTEAVLALAGLASVLYLIAVWPAAINHVHRNAKGKPALISRRGLWICLGLALLMRVPLVPVEPTLSDDIYRYVWDGRVQRLGVNPYVAVPSDPAYESLNTEVTRKMNHPALATIYPPFAQWVFRGIATIGESVIVFKLAFVFFDLLIILLLMRWLSRTGQCPWRVLVYAWNPLVVLEVAGSGHLDVIGVVLLVVSCLALNEDVHGMERAPDAIPSGSARTGNHAWIGFGGLAAALAFVAAIEVKFVPIVLVPLFWKRVRTRDAMLAIVFGLALAIPFFGGSMSAPIGALPTYLAKWRFNGFFFGLAESLIPSRWMTLLPAAAGLAVAAWFRFRSRSDSVEAWAWPLGAALLLMPTIYPWYLLWLVPFLGSIATLPLLVWTQSSLVTYFVWRVSASGGGWRLPWWVTLIEFGTVAAAALWAVAGSRRRVSEVH